MTRILALLQRYGLAPKAKEAATAAVPYGVPSVREGADGKQELYLYGECMSSLMAAFFFGDLEGAYSAPGVAKALDENEVDRVIINSIGGDVAEGIAIANMIAKRKLSVTVDGYAASIASVIAAASPDVTMARGAMMMVHKPWSALAGNATSMRAEASVLDVHEEAMLEIYAGRPRAKDRERYKALLAGKDGMDGSWLTGADAVAEGLADTAEATPAKAGASLEAAKLAPAVRAAFADSLPQTLTDPVAPEPPKAVPRVSPEPGEGSVAGRRVSPPGGTRFHY